MSIFGGGLFTRPDPSSAGQLAPAGGDYQPTGSGSTDDSLSPPAGPVFMLDQLKHAGVPLKTQMSPYLQMDPSIFRNAQPQYIMPEGNEHGKGKFEFALGHIGWAVGTGFAVGCLRGFIPELMNRETQRLTGRAWMTRMVNATMKHGSGYAQPAGTAMFLYSLTDVLMRKVRADDDLNSLAAGAITGALYRSPHGMRAAAVGSGVGFLLSTLWVMADRDSRQRMASMFNWGG